MITIKAVSDLHGKLDGLDFSDCDIAVIAGDITKTYGFGYWHVHKQMAWMEKQFSKMVLSFPNTEFVIIPGNHDLFADPHKSGNPNVRPNLPPNAHLLLNEGKTILGINFYGMSWVPHINGVWAYEDSGNGKMIGGNCDLIPEGTQVLVTHSPPRYEDSTIDISLQNHPSMHEHFGSVDLKSAIYRVAPRFVFCGHIHSGSHDPFIVENGPNAFSETTTIYNVSRVDETYEIAYDPTVVNFEM